MIDEVSSHSYSVLSSIFSPQEQQAENNQLGLFREHQNMAKERATFTIAMSDLQLTYCSYDL